MYTYELNIGGIKYCEEYKWILRGNKKRGKKGRVGFRHS